MSKNRYPLEEYPYSSIPSGEKLKPKKPFWRQHFFKIYAAVTTVLLILLGFAAITLLARIPAQPSSGPLSTPGAGVVVPSSTTSTGSEIPTPTPLPTPTSPPKPGVFCATGSSDGWKDWQVAPPWKLLSADQKLLLHDGSGRGTLMAPAFCQPTVPDYAVEARIRFISGDGGSEFGIVARGSYIAGIESWSDYDGFIDILGGDDHSIDGLCYNYGPDYEGLAVGGGYHTYRMEIRGNKIDLLLDGANVCSASDNRYLTLGEVGLYANDQIEVSDFKVIYF